jgi:hypothetical protein
MSDTEWVEKEFPGDGLRLPTDDERDRADAIIAQFSAQWGEDHPPIPRTHPDETDEGYGNTLAGYPTNRAYMRSRLRRWWTKS